MDFIEILHTNKIQRSWVAIGAFDGVHKGHQALFSRLTTGAKLAACRSVAITFDPLPAVFFNRLSTGNALTTSSERLDLLKKLDVDEVIVLQFDQDLANVDAASFMKVLKTTIGIERLLAGYNFSLGKNRTGTVHELRAIGHLVGYHIEVMDPIKVNSEIVSSSNIRLLLSRSDIKTANLFLGRPYTLSGPVVHGENRGEKLGIPTANLAIPAERLLPANGVYACKAVVDGKTYQAVTNIGVRPTFETPLIAPRVEPHLLDTDERFYGKTLKLEFYEFLRPEVKFPDGESLVAQIRQDIEKARGILNNES